MLLNEAYVLGRVIDEACKPQLLFLLNIIEHVTSVECPVANLTMLLD